MKFRKPDSKTIGRLKGIVGAANFLTDKVLLERYTHDEYAEDNIRRFPDAVVRPGSTAEVSEILKLANENRIPVTPRGGGTGLCGGCVPVSGGIVISLERMNRVIEIDRQNMMALVEAGLSLGEFYRAIKDTGFFFPPHPGDEGAQIGGLIATNAGGARAVKHGVIRNYVRGIEFVLADGRIIEPGGRLMKSSTGYSLLNLVIGSEGTLGVVTKAILNLMPSSGDMLTLVVPFPTIRQAIKSVPDILLGGIVPLALEFIDKRAIEATEHHLDRKWPSHEGEAHLMFIIDAPSKDDLMDMAERISKISLSSGAMDVFVADDVEKQRNVLEIRSMMYEAMRIHMIDLLDVCVPRASIDEFVYAVRELEIREKLWLPAYGHVADGNVHVHIMKERFNDGVWTGIPGAKGKAGRIRDELHAAGRRLNGVVSGEHGIGIVKKPYMKLFLDDAQLELMRGIKKVFDPNGILNPGKVLPD